MKKLSLFPAVLILVSLMIGPADVQAVGLGFYAEGGGGSGEITFENYGFYGEDVDYDIDTSHTGIGFMLDTSVADESAFNYRLSVGYEAAKIENQFNEEVDLGAVVVINDFGFALVRDPRIRFWIGPEVKLGYYNGEEDNLGIMDFTYVSFGIGPAVGINIGLSDTVFLTVKGSYVYNSFAGEVEYDTGDSYDINGTYGEGVLSAGMLFNLSR